MELVVAQAGFCQTVQGRSADATAEIGRSPEPDVVDQYDHHVRRIFWRVNFELGRRHGLAGVDFGDRIDVPIGRS